MTQQIDLTQLTVGNDERLLDDRQLLTIDQVAERLQVSTDLVEDWLNQGLIKHFRIRRTKRVQETDLQKFIEEYSA